MMHPDLEPTAKAWQTIIASLRIAAEHHTRQKNFCCAEEASLLSNLFDETNPAAEREMYRDLRSAGLIETTDTFWAVSRALIMVTA